MKKVFAYIIRFTAILLSVIFLTLTGVDAAIAGNNLEIEPVQVQQPILKASESKAIASKLPEEVIQKNPPYDLVPKCSVGPRPIPRNCDSSDPRIRRAYKKYLSAFFKCKNGRGTPKEVKEAWNELRRLCHKAQTSHPSIDVPITHERLKQNPVAP